MKALALFHKKKTGPVMLFQDPVIGMALAKRLAERSRCGLRKKERPVEAMIKEDRYYAA